MSDFKIGDAVLCKNSRWVNTKTGIPSVPPNPIEGQEYTIKGLDTSDEILGLYLHGFERSYQADQFIKPTGNLSMEFVKTEEIIKKNKSLILKN